MFPGVEFVVKSAKVSSGVSSQPSSSEETYEGALNRVHKVTKLFKDADFWVAIEGGIDEKKEEMEVFAWIVIASKDIVGKSKTGTFFLPNELANLIRQGKELSEANSVFFDKPNSTEEDGTIGILTENVIDKTHFYEHAIILALLPFKRKNMYAPSINSN